MRRPLIFLSGWCVAVFAVSLLRAQVPVPAPPQVQPAGVQGARMRIQLQQRLLQRGIQRQVDDEGNEVGDGYAFREDRETLTALRKAAELAEQKRFAEAAEALGRLMEASEDHFIKPAEGGGVYRSAKTEARRALGEMSKEGRDSYELQFGALARRKLDEAAAAGDIDGVAEVARQFFHTRAGYEAVFLLGMYHADHGRPQAAVHAWRPLLELDEGARAGFEPTLSLLHAKALLESGHEAEARDAVIAARGKYANAPIEYAGERLAWFDTDAQAVDWLRKFVTDATQRAIAGDWAIFRGGPSRNEPSLGGTPLLAYRWRVPTANDDPAVERAIADMHDTYRDEGLTTLPALQPLAVGDTILMRSARNLMAIDFRTGKRIWEVPTDNPFEQLPSGASSANLGGGRSPYGMEAAQGLFELLERRIWDDAIFGTFSSDGQYVFAVESADADASAYAQQSIFFGAGGVRFQSMLGGAAGTNRLAAFDVKTGKLKWEIGGPKGNFPLDQAGSFFLGPPLPLFGKLYVLAEVEGEIRLLALEPANGALAWSQQIAVGAQEFLADQLPHVSGATPSYADGVLVCPTSAGAVVGIDLSSRALLWGVRYPRQLDSWMYAQNRNQIIQMNMFPGSRTADSQLRWCDSTATIADGRVLFAPSDSDKLACHDLFTGARLWEAPRRDGLYVACVEDGRAFVVGARGLRAIKMENGRDAWDGNQGQFADKVHPSGRGFFSEHQYYLPTTSGDVLAIDLNTGAVRSVARRMTAVGDGQSDRSPLGNLICHRGAVLSHGAEYLECFDQVDVLAEKTSAILAATPDDPRALMRMGEIQLQRREYAGAIASLRRAWELAENPGARRLLVDAYLTVLEQDFPAVKDQLADMESIFQKPLERHAFLRLKAAGLEAAGDRLAAFAAYQDLAGVTDSASADTLESIEPFWRVRRDRLVRGHLERLYETAAAAKETNNVAEMDRRVEESWKSAGGLNAPRESLENFVAHYGGFPRADEAKLQLARVRAAQGEWLPAETLLMDLEKSRQAEVARHAWAMHATLLNNAGRADDAVIYYRRLAEEWADADCGDSRTGKEWVAALPADHAVRKALAGVADFPIGKVTHEEQTEEFEPSNRGNFVELEGSLGPFWRSRALLVGQAPQRGVVALEDGFGNREWELPLVDPKSPEQTIAIPNATLSQGRVHGHLAVLAYGYHLFAIDPLGDPRHSEPRILWRADLNDPLPGMGRMMGIMQATLTQRFAPQRNIALDNNNHRLGNTACLGDIGLVYQRGRMLCCVSPYTGELLWSRDNMVPGCDLSGDEEVVVVIPPGAEEGILLDAVDGHELARRQTVAIKDRVMLQGRCELSWRGELGDRECDVRFRDLLEDRDVWTQKFNGNARAWLVDGEALGVFEPSGAFKLIRIQDGGLIVNEALDPPNRGNQSRLGPIHIMSSRDQYTLLVNQTLTPAQRREFSPIPLGLNPSVLAQGKLYAFDRRSGKSLWDKPREITGQALPLRQPTDMPVLVFLSQSVENGRLANRKGNLLCIDKRNGRELYAGSFELANNNNQPNGLNIAADATAKTVLVATRGKAVKLHFTDQAVPEEAPDAAGDLQANQKKSGAGSILFSAIRALGSASKGIADPFGKHAEDFEIADDGTPQDPQYIEIIEPDPFGGEDIPPPFEDGVPALEDLIVEDPFGADDDAVPPAEEEADPQEVPGE